jgi:putative heme-binding domain-containing protein
MFKLSGPPGRPTAACGLGVYRDELLGGDFNGNIFVAEPANNLVHRLVVSPSGTTFAGVRAKGEADVEFLAATDLWFRPVQIRTGPDGCVWVVDMHRSVIEHKVWIPAEELEPLDIFAGHNEGRIYRVRPQNTLARPIERLDQLDDEHLAAALDSPNGPQRDLAQQLLVQRQAHAAAPKLKDLAKSSKRGATRLQAMCALEGIGELDAATLQTTLADQHPGVRRHAIRLSEPYFAKSPEIVNSVLRLTEDSDPQIQVQVAYSLGELDNPQAAKALAKMAWAHRQDKDVQAAVWSSVSDKNVQPIVVDLISCAKAEPLPATLLGTVVRMSVKLGGADGINALAAELTNADEAGKAATWRLEAAAELVKQCRDAGVASAGFKALLEKLAPLVSVAKATLESDEKSETRLLPAMRLLAASGSAEQMLPALDRLLAPQTSAAVQQAVVKMAATLEGPAAAKAILGAWKAFTPPTRAVAFDIMLGRHDLTAALMDAVEAGQVRLADLSALQRERLLKHRNEMIRHRAVAALASAIDANRDKLVKQYLAAPAGEPTAERGRKIFTKVCSGCHQLEGAGHVVGPDLAALTSRTRQALTESILDPNRAVDARYQMYTALSVDGLSHAGILAEETSTSVTLVEQEGKSYTLLRADLEVLENSGRSLMPEGLEKDVSPSDMLDLIAYLTTQESPPKQLAGNSPRAASPDYDGAIWLLASNSQIYGGDVTFETPFKNIGYWHGQHDYVAWEVKTPESQDYEVFVHLACAPGDAGSKAVLEGGSPPLSLTVPSTGGYDRYQVIHAGRTSLAEGLCRLSLRPDGPLSTGNLMDLRGVYLSPVGKPTERAEHGDAPADGDDAATHIAKLLDGLAVGTKAEYERIPAIWEQAIAAGKRNEPGELIRVLELCLPAEDGRLADWQAVVIGGGLINGVSQAGAWPRQRFSQLLEDRPQLTKRWQNAIDRALAMADDPATPAGTRYDALRMLGVLDFKRAGGQLIRYVGTGSNQELEMGAVSALGDIDSPASTRALIDAYPKLHANHRRTAIKTLLRSNERTKALQTAIQEGRIPREDIGEEQASLIDASSGVDK